MHFCNTRSRVAQSSAWDRKFFLSECSLSLAQAKKRKLSIARIAALLPMALPGKQTLLLLQVCLNSLSDPIGPWRNFIYQLAVSSALCNIRQPEAIPARGIHLGFSL